MNYTGIGIVERSKLTKLLHSIQVKDLISFHGALRGSDAKLQYAFSIFLANNFYIPGVGLALEKLTTCLDPATAIRASAVCLLAARLQEQD